MGWISRTPSLDRINIWRGTLPGGHKVARWPHPNTIRIDPKYRMKYVAPTMYPLASRWGVWYRERFATWDPDTPEDNAFGWFDFEVRGEHHIGHTIPVNEHGFGAELDIQIMDEFVPPNPGLIQIAIEFTRPGLPLLHQRGVYSNSDPSLQMLYTNDTIDRPPIPGWSWEDLGDPGELLHVMDIFGVSECYNFIEEDVGMASFNGTDAYIKLTDLMTFTNNPFRLSAEIRLNQTANHWPIFGRDGVGGFFGMKDDDIIFGNMTLDTTWTPVTDVWFTWVYEFEPVTQLQHKLTIAGTVVRDSTNNRQFPQMDTIGVYKHGISGTLWADMDVRDLKLETGTPGNYTTLLDMPLRANALDSGPQENHGTTFNMALPSV